MVVCVGDRGGQNVGMGPLHPAKGSNLHRLRQYIARKPDSTGIKLYVLCDNKYGYVVNVYLYTGRRRHIRRTGTCARNLDPKGIMRWWGLQLPPESVLVADSFFGSRGLAEYFPSINRLF